MEPVKFGTDGWRAIIGDTYTFENVRRVSLATARTFKISGFGHYSLLDRVNVFDTYEDKDVADIVRDIGTQIEAKVGIRAISSEIVKTGYRVTKIGFDGEKAKEAERRKVFVIDNSLNNQVAEFEIDIEHW